MVQQKPGDWICSQCGNHNFASRTECNRCGASKASGGVVGGGGGVVGGGGGGPAPKPGDWVCPSCGNNNFAHRTECNKCHMPRPPATPSGRVGGGGGGASNNAKPGDWTCAMCGNLNFAHRTECNRCKAPKTLLTAGGSGGAYGPSKGWPSMTAAAPYNPYMPAAGVARPSNMKEGDWICQACGNHNYAKRDACNKCNSLRKFQRPNGASAVDVGGIGAFLNAALGQPMPAMSMKSALPGNNVKDGDWMCARCGNHNFASRTKCNKCNALKPGVKEGDWICRSCRNHNYASRTECNKCGAPKPSEFETVKVE